MSKKTNEFGLSRNIPADVAREVRKRCGFGCVICGCAIYTYEHVDPLFAEAKEHDPEKIVLLCGGCHDRVTRKLLSKETVKQAAQDPRCLTQGFSFGPFDVGNTHPDVIIGTFQAIETQTVIRILGEPILRVDPPEEQGGPFRLSAILCDRTGEQILRVENNEWKAPIQNWDVEIIGPRIIIRRAAGDITLRLRSDPPKTLVIEKLDMYYQGSHIVCEEGKKLRVESPSGHYFEAYPTTVEGSKIGIDISNLSLAMGVGGRISFSVVAGLTQDFGADHAGEVFTNEEVALDGGKFENCTFENCDLVFRARAAVVMTKVSFGNIRWLYADAAALTLNFLSSIYNSGDPHHQAAVEDIFENVLQGVHLTTDIAGPRDIHYVNKTFANERISLDGNKFENCTFENCDLVFHGWDAVIIEGGVTLENVRWVLDDAASLTLNFLSALYKSGNSDSRTVVENIFDDIRINSFLTTSQRID